MDKTDYEQIFRHRGASYHKAMVDFPGVRSREFQQLFSDFPLKPRETIIDCPALGGYLEENLNIPVKVQSLDFCPQSNKVRPLNEFTLDSKVDRVVCLASSHHINNLDSFLCDVTKYLKPKGYLHLADVGVRSSIRYFLDEFVNQWTSTGHSGIWRDFETFPLSFKVKGLRVLSVEERDCHWEFQRFHQIAQFCRLLFGLDLNPSDQDILTALKDYVGISSSGGSLRVMWKLTYTDFVKDV